MKNKELFSLSDTLLSLKELKGVTFNYAVARNLAKLKIEIDSLKESTIAKADFDNYEAARIELCKTASKKSDDGKEEPIVINGQFIIEDQSAFDVALAALRVEYKDAIDARDVQIKEFNELLEKESGIEIFKIDIACIPEAITTEQMKGILPLIKE